MGLPERRFYTLNKAVDKINKVIKNRTVDTEDLLYFAFEKKLELCVYYYSPNSEGKCGNIFIQAENDIDLDLLPMLFPEEGNLNDIIKTEYGRINCNLFYRSEELKKEFPISSYNYQYPFVNSDSDIFYIHSLLAIDLSTIQYPIINDIIINRFSLPAESWAISFDTYRLLKEHNELDLLKSIKVNAIVELDDPVKLSPNQMLITSNELENFLNGKEKIESNFVKSSFIGRPENSFKKDIIEIAKLTRKQFPTCSGKSLSQKIYDYFNHLPEFPKRGSIEQYISLSSELPRQIERDLKLSYELVIPEHLKHLKNK